MSWQCL